MQYIQLIFFIKNCQLSFFGGYRYFLFEVGGKAGKFFDGWRFVVAVNQAPAFLFYAGTFVKVFVGHKLRVVAYQVGKKYLDDVGGGWEFFHLNLYYSIAKH
jgi:hypothetical protein